MNYILIIIIIELKGIIYYIYMNTTLVKINNSERNWHLINAENKKLGKLAVVISFLLRGRNKTIYSPHIDNGDFVVIINASKLIVTGKKEIQKKYMFYSGYFGNEKYIKYKDLIKTNPEKVIKLAVKRMMPDNKLSRQMIKKLKIYNLAIHSHIAQNPQLYTKFY